MKYIQEELTIKIGLSTQYSKERKRLIYLHVEDIMNKGDLCFQLYNPFALILVNGEPKNEKNQSR